MYRSNIQNSKLRKGVLPQKQTRDVKPAQGTIDTSALHSADFSEAASGFVSGRNGRDQIASGIRYPAVDYDEFREDTMTGHWDAATSRMAVPRQAKDLWKLVANHLHSPGGAYTKTQAAFINKLINNKDLQESATELMALRNSDTPLTGPRQMRRYELEKVFAETLTLITRNLRVA